jgi:hypothetical protein
VAKSGAHVQYSPTQSSQAQRGRQVTPGAGTPVSSRQEWPTRCALTGEAFNPKGAYYMVDRSYYVATATSDIPAPRSIDSMQPYPEGSFAARHGKYNGGHRWTAGAARYFGALKTQEEVLRTLTWRAWYLSSYVTEILIRALGRDRVVAVVRWLRDGGNPSEIAASYGRTLRWITGAAEECWRLARQKMPDSPAGTAPHVYLSSQQKAAARRAKYTQVHSTQEAVRVVD